MTSTYLAVALALIPGLAAASSHREAPFIATQPQLDASDFYMFMSYEANRPGYVTLLANYDPLQDAESGPNFHFMDPSAAYDFHIDSTGSGKSDLVFRFKFTNTFRNLTVPAGGVNQAEPLLNIGSISAADQSNLNRAESYSVEVLRNDGTSSLGQLANASSGAKVFTKPVDNIGNKSIADYESYANSYVYSVTIPGCSSPGRVFAGQRKDGFVADLGRLFDLVNLNPLGARDAGTNSLAKKSVTTLALEVPASCLGATAQQPILGAWTTSSAPRYRTLYNSNMTTNPFGDLTQVSRLGSPLVNEVVIGLKDKDKFNNSVPARDTQFLSYVTNPTLPVLLNALFGTAVPASPRNDLVSVFLTGVQGLNKPANVTPAEELRLNTSIAPTAPASQNDLGVLGGDLSGFPNGRRPYDDVIDIALRAELGALCSSANPCGSQTVDPNNGAPATDGAHAAGATAATSTITGNTLATDTYLDHFPYLNTPLPGSVNTPPPMARR